MNQAATVEISMMLEFFGKPPTAALLSIYDGDLAGISNLAICETAKRFRRSELPYDTFEPLGRQFVRAAREYDRARGPRQALPPPKSQFERLPELPRRTEDEKQRQRERMAKFHGSDGTTLAELAAIRANYDPDELAKVPDAPLPHGWSRVA